MAKARYQISTAVSKEMMERIDSVRKSGWTIPKIVIAGVVVAEKILAKKGNTK